MMIHRILLMSCLAALWLPAAAWSYVEVGRSRFVPWSGYWWKIQEGRIMSPLRKYDYLTSKYATAWESRAKDRRNAAPWAGYCHAWSAAAVMEREPRRSRSVRGLNGKSLVLSVGDQKAWLTICHDGDDANFHGNRYNGKRGDDLHDIAPDILWRYLRLYVKQRGVPLVLDIDPREPVWNYPVYSYRITTRNTATPTRKLARMEIWMADDKVHPNFIGTRVKKKTYMFTFSVRGKTLIYGTGRWYGASRYDHPDFAWYPTMVKPKNPYISPTVVRKMLGVNATRLASRRDPEDLPPEVKDIAASRRIGVSSTDLAVLLAGTSSPFALDLNLAADAKGSTYAIRGKSAKDGYLYLFGMSADGQVRLLWPTTGQDNRVQAGKTFTMTGFARPQGAYRVKGLVSTKPLSLGSLQEPLDDGPKTEGMGLAFDWSPSEEQLVKDLLTQVAQKKLTLAELEESTGTKPSDLLGEFGRAEVTVRVK